MHLTREKCRTRVVKMDSPAMQYFVSRRDDWAAGDLFASPGPRQFWGPTPVRFQFPCLAHLFLLSKTRRLNKIAGGFTGGWDGRLRCSGPTVRMR